MSKGSIAQEMPVEHAAMSVHIAVSDFVIAIQQATTVDEALRIHRLIAETRASLAAAESAALDRADRLCDRS